MATQYGIASLKVGGYIPKLGRANLYAANHTFGTLHKPGETNSIGLVMFGDVEFAGARDVIPSGTNREYGYWRGSQYSTFIDKFDQAWLPLEGSGITAGVPNVNIVVSAQENTGPTGADGFYGSSCSESETCTWMWDGADWSLSGNSCPDGCGCEGTNPTDAGSFPGDAVSVACTGGDSTPGETGGTGENVGFARWEKAGALRTQIGQEAIQERCLFLSKRSFVNVGSGVDLSEKHGYSIYAKVVPSGDVTGTVILGQHRENPAQFVMGCDYDGKYYIRSDHTVSGVNTPVFARSSKSFEAYDYPAQIFGVYSSGDSSLKIYVNGQKEGESQNFTRETRRAANTNVTIGKREFAIAERGFTGWIDQAGITNTTIEDTDIKEFYKNTFEITSLIFNTKVTPTGSSGLSGSAFGDTGLDALNNNYVEFVADSGIVSRLNPDGARGGAFDKALWGQNNFAISSVLTFDLTEIPARFYQLTDLNVSLWVEHITNHPSGADLSARLKHKDNVTDERNINWYPSGVSVPSGSKQLINITHPLPTLNYYNGGQQSVRQDLDDHQLELVLKYPKSNHPYDANFRIYSTKLSYSGFDQLAKYNTKDGLIEGSIIRGHSITDVDGNVVGYDTGDKSIPFIAIGASATKASGILNFFMDVGTADQSMNLVLNQDPTTNMGDTAKGFLVANGSVLLNDNMNLYTVGGQFNQSIPLFLKQKDPLSIISPTLGLETIGGTLSFPRAQKVMPLFLDVDAGFGSPSGNMNLVMPSIHAPIQFANRLLYIEGLQPVNDIPLYLEAVKSSNNNVKLFTRGPTFYTPSGSMNLFIKQRDFYGNAFFNAVATVLTTGHIPLNITGFAAPTGAMNLVMPTIASGTQDTTLFTSGY
tara:strand:- start:399 stop:3020 length:2622 start_codon:yes stop_codon:yes gene_type:complete